MINVEQKQHENLVLTSEGKSLAENGSYEATFYSLIPDEGLLQAEMKVTTSNFHTKSSISRYALLCFIQFLNSICILL